MKNILIACEESQAIANEFRKRGFNAFSNDLQECSGGHPEYHIVDSCLFLIDGDTVFRTQDGQWHVVVKWDLIIAHPPCTDLCVSGARHFAKKREDGRQQKSIDFFMEFTRLDCPRVCIENPIGIMSTIWRKPDQIIHPWQFGDNYEKSTCLWLKGLPKLIPEVTEKPDLEYFEWVDKNGKHKRQPLWYYKASHNTKLRSKTFPGIARAIAEQWGGVL